jgi:hypothetical protein
VAPGGTLDWWVKGLYEFERGWSRFMLLIFAVG